MEVGWGRNPTREEGSDLSPPVQEPSHATLCSSGLLGQCKMALKVTSSKLGWTCYLRPSAINRLG